MRGRRPYSRTVTTLPVGQWRETRAGACELKFLIDGALGPRIAEWARARLPADPHGAGRFGDEYDVTSLYFDTEAHDVLHARGSFGRSKYRVRRYGCSEVVFLERKLRKPGLLHKRRTLTPVRDLDRLIQPAPDAGWPGQWFHRRLLARRLKPSCELTYRRLARALAVNGSLVRLTLDDEIYVSPAAGLGFGDRRAVRVLSGQMVLELKFRREVPALFKALLEDFALSPRVCSKYRHGMAALGHRGREIPRRGMTL